jgi:hypothetical protein
MEPDIENIINSLSTIYKNSMVQVCDIDYKFRFIGADFPKILGITDNEILGKNLSEIDCPIQHMSREYYTLNQPVMALEAPDAHYVTYFNRGNEILIVENKVRPIKLGNRSLGIFIESNPVNELSMTNFKIISSLSNHTGKIHDLSNTAQIRITNEIQELIIFLIVIGKSDKEIAEVLKLTGINLSCYGVSKFISRKIFPKFNVTLRNQLITKIYSLGLNNKLPDLLINDYKLLHSVLP